VSDTKTEVGSKPEHPVYQDKDGWHVNFDFTLDTLIIIGLAAFALWRRVVRPFLVERFYWAINPFEEERKIPILLAQMKAVTNASQVLVGTFHNGEIDHRGYHLKKFSVIYFWGKDGIISSRSLPTNIPAEKLTAEIDRTIETKGWNHAALKDMKDRNCISYLEDNGLSATSTRMIMMGNIPIGMISIQYATDDFENRELNDYSVNAVLEDLFNQLQSLMKRRFKHSIENANVFKKLFNAN
jgi:hypothetical protein